MPEFQFSSEELESRLQNVLRALHPRQLLENVCGPAFERPGTRDFRIGLGGGYSDGWGQRHAEANAWPVLRAFFENDPRMRSALRGAESLGLHGRFGGDQEHNMHVFQYIFDVDDNACVFIRRRAFQNKIHFPGDKTAWEKRFEHYLQQNWTKNNTKREYYRTHFELVDWPQPPRDLWPT